MLKIARHLLLAVVCAATLAGCTNDKAQTITRPTVLATMTIIGDMVSVVGGERIEVETLLPVGIDPHTYEPRPDDVKKITRAQLVFANGLGIELWLEELIQNAGGQRPLIYLAEPLRAVAFVERAGSYAGRPDPHLWNNVEYAMRYVDEIARGLSELDPEGKEIFSQNAERYKAQLAKLHRWVLEQIQTVPVENRKLVTAHDAFRYLCERYGLEFLGAIWGIATDEDPSAEKIARLVDDLKRTRIPAVFVETTVNPRFLMQIAQDTGVKIGGTLYSDSLGPPGSAGDTYIKMMVHNVKTITEALGGHPSDFTE
ncbi:metal ABC transporter substrate-binding protein [Candidatus Acetothermia bacterium]|nr:metal ABC transporter substrate-binding protein [Candidatus Acetothermia bacterium]MCI2431014.1 metal ABC transporter substrate-binding protein [Candidatus Acetothermia bacterium]MCI2436910.1 metal ABC transporter substrate-binding protein [Candidatus Acetothermia bacterium]